MAANPKTHSTNPYGNTFSQYKPPPNPPTHVQLTTKLQEKLLIYLSLSSTVMLIMATKSEKKYILDVEQARPRFPWYARKYNKTANLSKIDTSGWTMIQEPPLVNLKGEKEAVQPSEVVMSSVCHKLTTSQVGLCCPMSN